jgi:hypothetical protein
MATAPAQQAPTKTPRQMLMAAEQQSADASTYNWAQVVEAFGTLSAAWEIATNLVNNKNSIAVQGFKEMIATDAWKNLCRLVSTDLSMKTLGLIGGGEGSLIVGGKGLFGLLTGTDNSGEIYSYESVGVSVGAQEGGVAIAGLYLHSEQLDGKDYAIEMFASVAADVGVGVAVETFATAFTGYGDVVLLTTGEELEASIGASYSYWQPVE